MTKTGAERCTRSDCPGFKDWRVVHPAEHDGRTVIIDDVPARVCFLCGETRFSEATRRRIEDLLEQRGDGALPLLQFE